MRVKPTRLFLFAGALLAVVPLALNADTLNGTGGSWQTWSANNLYQSTGTPTPGVPYWNNLSGDGPQGNIGWCLVGGGPTCNLASTYGTLPYFGTTPTTGSNPNSVGNMYFTSSGSPLSISVLGPHTSQTTSTSFDNFGYYIVPTSGTPTLVQLFSTQSNQLSAGSSTTIDLPAGTEYGFYIENVVGPDSGFETDEYFYMNSAWNAWLYQGSIVDVTDPYQHFAVFQDGTGYIVGDVNSFACPAGADPNQVPCESESQFDYNDLIVSVASVPEPGTSGLLGLSLLLAGAGLWSKRQRTA